jgi:hypothetical protein
MNKEGFLAILSQIAQNLIKFKRFSFVKSHFTDPIYPFSRLRHATEGKSAGLEAKIWTFRLVKRPESCSKR